MITLSSAIVIAASYMTLRLTESPSHDTDTELVSNRPIVYDTDTELDSDDRPIVYDTDSELDSDRLIVYDTDPD